MIVVVEMGGAVVVVETTLTKNDATISDEAMKKTRDILNTFELLHDKTKKTTKPNNNKMVQLQLKAWLYADEGHAY